MVYKKVSEKFPTKKFFSKSYVNYETICTYYHSPKYPMMYIRFFKNLKILNKTPERVPRADTLRICGMSFYERVLVLGDSKKRVP